uniref:Uncharacterized protein n=1 Tax=Panagrolaimus superbus TaxID=310955 RepID=A0A914YHV3_9BILA
MKGGKLKIHTAVPERTSLPVAEKTAPKNKFHRSYSVPPMNAQIATSSKVPQQKASISFEPKSTKHSSSTEHRPSINPSLHSRYDRDRKISTFSRTRSSIRSGSSCGSSMVYPSTAHYPIGYNPSYSSYNNAPCPPRPAHYGMAPFDMLLGHLLTGGQYHPLHPAYAAGTFMGPNRFMGGFAW